MCVCVLYCTNARPCNNCARMFRVLTQTNAHQAPAQRAATAETCVVSRLASSLAGIPRLVIKYESLRHTCGTYEIAKQKNERARNNKMRIHLKFHRFSNEHTYNAHAGAHATKNISAFVHNTHKHTQTHQMVAPQGQPPPIYPGRSGAPRVVARFSIKDQYT